MANGNSKDGLKYPAGEILEARLFDIDGELAFIITTKKASDYHYLYSVEGTVFKKLGKATSPLELESKFETRKRMLKE